MLVILPRIWSRLHKGLESERVILFIARVFACNVLLRNKGSIKIDSQCKYALVARGEAGLYLRYSGVKYKEKIWDHAAGLLCVEEAGGRVTDITGAPLDFSKGESLFANTGIVASNGKTHAQVLEVIARVDPIGKDSA
jgi:3'-phosphoadenosine 5'-phosphosulfate (PAPS) 3'-phosphatase